LVPGSKWRKILILQTPPPYVQHGTREIIDTNNKHHRDHQKSEIFPFTIILYSVQCTMYTLYTSVHDCTEYLYSAVYTALHSRDVPHFPALDKFLRLHMMSGSWLNCVSKDRGKLPPSLPRRLSTRIFLPFCQMQVPVSLLGSTYSDDL